MRHVPKRRLFFALWPDSALRRSAAERAAALVPAGHGRPQRPDQLHLTLAFLGDVAEERLSDVRAVASQLEGEPFTVVLDRLEHWRKPGVLCLAASEVPAALGVLVDRLRAAITARGLPAEVRPYRPHLTLARKLARFDGPCAVEPLHWRADAITLVESRADRAGSRYEPLGSWPLGGAET